MPLKKKPNIELDQWKWIPRTIRWAKYSLPSRTSIKSQNLDSFHICVRSFLASFSLFAWRNRWIISRSCPSRSDIVTRSLGFLIKYKNSFNFNVNGLEELKRVDVSLVFVDWDVRRSNIDNLNRNGRRSIEMNIQSIFEMKRKKKIFMRHCCFSLRKIEIV